MGFQCNIGFFGFFGVEHPPLWKGSELMSYTPWPTCKIVSTSVTICHGLPVRLSLLVSQSCQCQGVQKAGKVLV